MPGQEDITELLAKARDGDRGASEKVIRLTFEELHRLAGGYLRGEEPNHTLQATALVHEAYMKLCDQRADWRGRQHFLAVAATVMRRLLADHARRRRADKRGGDLQRVTLDAGQLPFQEKDLELIALDDALDKLAHLHERQARIVEMRFLAGMTVEEVASELQVSRSTVEAEWRGAQAWLHRELSGD